VDETSRRQLQQRLAAMRDQRRRLQVALHDAAVSTLLTRVTLAEITRQHNDLTQDGPPELEAEGVAARVLIAESFRLERQWRRAGVSAP
jgi:glycerol-3-phosphate O-acyltransferase